MKFGHRAKVERLHATTSTVKRVMAAQLDQITEDIPYDQTLTGGTVTTRFTVTDFGDTIISTVWEN